MTAKALIVLGAALLPGWARADQTELRWTNTVRLSTEYQFNEVPPLTDGYCSGGLNCGYGPAFTQGRADWLSELDAGRGDYGLHASLEARKDMVEPDSSYIEPFEAYIRGAAALAGRPLDFSIGRQSVIWGESLYFAGNGIAGAQAPVDLTPGISSDGYQSGAHFLPVGQASFSWQVTDQLALLGYQQFEWRRNRVDPEDAYASAGDVLGAEELRGISLYGGEYGATRYLRGDDGPPPSGTGQFGLGLRLRREEWDVGLYGLQFDAKMPNLIYYRDRHDYSLDYARGIGLLGASLAGPVGDAALGAELSVRRHMPLTDGGIFLWSSDENGRLAIPRGDTVHGQASLTLPIEPSSILPGGASWATELAANHLAAVTADPGQLAPGRTRDAAALRTVLTAQFYQVLPRLDLSLPVGLGWNFAGRSAVIPEMNAGTGDIDLGVGATLDRAWTANLTLTLYFGQDRLPIPGYQGRPLSDWNKLAFAVQRSF